MAAPLPVLALGVGLIALREYTRRRSQMPGGPVACPSNPPAPPFMKIMHGIAPADLQAWALSIVQDPTTTFGQTFTRTVGDKMVIARVEHHPWTTHGAEIIAGCFKGVTLYESPYATTSGDADADDDEPDDTIFFPFGDGQWIGFPSGEPVDTEDLPDEPTDPSVHFSSGCCGGGYATGQYGEPPVSQDEAFAAASQLASMFPNVRAVVAQAPDGFYVRVITPPGASWGGRGLATLGPRGLRNGRRDGGFDMMAAMSRLPAQLGRVRIQIDRLVSPDFAVGAEFEVETVAPGLAIGSAFWTNEEFAAAVDRGEDPIGDVMRQAFAQTERRRTNAVAGSVDPWAIIPIDEARAAQNQLRRDLLDRCKCVLGWMRGVALSWVQAQCLENSAPNYYVQLLVDGSRMSDEARAMVPDYVGRVPVEIRDIGNGPVPVNTEIVAP